MNSFLKPYNLDSFTEHHNHPNGEVLVSPDSGCFQSIFFLGDKNKKCVELIRTEESTKLHTSYYVGIDWLLKNEHAIYVSPKFTKEDEQTNYIEMLFSALKHPEISKHSEGLYDIKFDEPYIEIEQQHDLLTPLLVVQFLRKVNSLVKKGLKKSYYKIEENQYCRVKGKIFISKTIKQNLLKNKPLNNYCTYDVFDVNNFENRLLKKALSFVRRYIPTLNIPQSDKYTSKIFRQIIPAFEKVSENVSLHQIKHGKTNAFYKEYEEALRIAKLILKRFGYNISNTEKKTVCTPPFWIDMSKLFELYALGLLTERFGNKVHYHYTKYWQELDYLLDDENYQMVIDAKYKTIYKHYYEKEDIRQVSGYARIRSVYEVLNKNLNENIDCLIIYPDQETGLENLTFCNLKDKPIRQFVNFYKVGIKIPLIK